MIPNDFGIIRQKDFALYALPFSDIHLSNYDFRIIEPEYIEGYYYNQTAVSTANADYCNAYVDVKGYDHVLIPMTISKGGITTYSGLREPGTSGAMNPRINLSKLTADTDQILCGYLFCEIQDKTDLFITGGAGIHKPVIVFKELRSDSANP